MQSNLFLSFSTGHLASSIVQAVAWVLVVVACLVAVRRPWAWPGLAGGLLGAAAATATVVDTLQLRSAIDTAGGWFAYTPDSGAPSILLEHDLYTEVMWVETAGIALVGVAVVVAALSARRSRTRPAA